MCATSYLSSDRDLCAFLSRLITYLLLRHVLFDSYIMSVEAVPDILEKNKEVPVRFALERLESSSTLSRKAKFAPFITPPYATLYTPIVKIIC